MEQLPLVLVFLFIVFLLLGTGVWIGLSLLGTAVVILGLFTSRPVGEALFTAIWSSSSSWTLSALPLFIWMGEILFRTRLSENMFRGLSPWMAGLPGGLLHTNIVGCTVFAAVSGSSAATLTTVGKMSIPELRKRNYREEDIIGTLAGASTLGLLIPPSLALIVYGVTVNMSITKLFMAGIVPGIVLALMFMTYIVLKSLISRKGNFIDEPRLRLVHKLRESYFLIPVVGLIIVIIGSLYLGLATTNEAAAFGVTGALLLAFFQGTLTMDTFIASLMGAVRTSAMINMIIFGASALSLSMGFTGLPRIMAEWIGTFDLSPLSLILVLMVFYIILGFFLDGISSMLLTMSIVLPMVVGAGYDPLWFGIFLVVVIEIAQITPPVGFNLFVLKGMTDHDIGYLCRAALPMFLVMVLMIFILIGFPELATWLPNNM